VLKSRELRDHKGPFLCPLERERERERERRGERERKIDKSERSSAQLG